MIRVKAPTPRRTAEDRSRGPGAARAAATGGAVQSPRASSASRRSCCVLVFAATMLALYPPSWHRGSNGAELLNTDRKQIADGLANLPSSYGDLAPKPPKLGPPLPGDLGPPVTHVEQNCGLRPEPGGRCGAGRADAPRAPGAGRRWSRRSSSLCRSAHGQAAGGVAAAGKGPGGAAAATGVELTCGAGASRPRSRPRSQQSAAQARFPQRQSRTTARSTIRMACSTRSRPIR